MIQNSDHLEEILSKLITMVELRSSMNEGENWRFAMQLKQKVTHASTENEITITLSAIERLQDLRTPFSHYVQMQILDGINSWVVLNSMSPKAKKAYGQEFGPPISSKDFQSTCKLMYCRLAELIARTLTATRGAKKTQELRAQVLEILQSLIPYYKSCDLIAIVNSVLSSNKSGDYDQSAALDTLGAYYESCRLEKPEKSLISLLKKLAENEPSERVAFSALQALVQCREINEWGAMALRDNWKDKFVFG